MDPQSRLDRSVLPTEYLESFPYPAFILLCPIAPPASALAPEPSAAPDEDFSPLPSPRNHVDPFFTRSIADDAEPFSPVFANAKWRNLTQGADLLQCLSIADARQLGDWISGARQKRQLVEDKREASAWGESRRVDASLRADRVRPEPRHEGSQLPPPVGGPSLPVAAVFADSSNSDQPASPRPTLDEAPEGFWEPEIPPYEDRGSSSGRGSFFDENTGMEGTDNAHPGPATLTIQLVHPGKVTLELTKTSLPVWRFARNGARNRVAAHSYVVVTTTPRSGFVLNSEVLATGRSPVPGTDHDDTARPTPYHTSRKLSELRLEDDDNDPSETSTLPPDAPVTAPPFQHHPSSSGVTVRPTQPAPSTSTSTTAQASRVETPLLPVDNPMDGLHPGRHSGHSRPLFFNKDGTVSRKSRGALGLADMGEENRGQSTNPHDLLKRMDWSKTPLGPRDQWPQSLKTIVSLVMQYPHQCCLWWGKDLTLIYNPPYAETIHKHPNIFGMSGPVAWAEIWSSIGPLSELVLSGTPVWKDDDFLLFKQMPHQGGGLFEAFHSWMWVPVLQEDGTVGGLWNATIDTTKKVLAERRLASVREMGQRTSIARTMQEFDSAVLEILAANARDVPFAVLYHVSAATKKPEVQQTAQSEDPSKTHSLPSQTTRVNLQLAGAVGVPEGHASAPSCLSISLKSRKRDRGAPAFTHGAGITGSPTMSIVSSLSGPQPSTLFSGERSTTPFSDDGTLQSATDQWPFQEALSTRRLVLIEDCSALIADYPIQVWDELPTSAIVVPITNDSDEGTPGAVLVIGLSIRRPFDEDYESFVHMLRLQLASGIAAVRSYEAERQRIEELAALDRAKSLLFSNVSHELRTPLTLVSGPLDDLLAETAEGPKKEMLVIARRNVRRLTRLVSTLMDVSRLEAGRLKGSFRLVNLGTMTRDLAGLFRGAIERSKLRYVVEADLTPRNVYVDPEHWEKIMFNLIGNALKYTMSGTITVSLSYSGNEAVLSVQDSGVGIPKSDINLIGERFHRVQSVSRSHEGTGIGLSLIKELIKLHGGTLEIESVTTEESASGLHGSTFHVRIPMGSDHLPRDAIETASAPGPSRTGYAQGIVDEAMHWNRDREGSSIDSSSDSGATGNGSGSLLDSSSSGSRGLDPSTLYFKKDDLILLVDDSSDTRRYMRSVFAPFCNLVEARDGLHALEVCEKTVPHLIITDVMMPNLDGFGLLARLRDSERLRMVPVIMLTARGGDEAKVEGLMAGADDYLSKPFNARELIARAHMQVQLGKRRRHLEEAFLGRTAELRALNDFLPVGIFRAQQDGTVTFTNQAWLELTGYPVDEPVTNWGDYIVPEHRPQVYAEWRRILDEGEAVTQMGDWQWSSGRWVTAKVIRLDTVASGLTGWLGCVTDITERKLHEESQRARMVEADQRRIEAEEAKRQQELLIDITSHEIRNPISSLMQCSSLVKTNLLSLLEQLQLAIRQDNGFRPTKQLLTTINEDLEALESIYQCGLAQERISNDVLSLGRIQLDMLQMFDVDTDIRQEAQKHIGIFQNEARMKRIALSLKIGESVDRLGINAIKIDPVRLGQVVTNLLSNGIRFTSNSSVRRIELSFDLSFEPPADGSCALPRLPDPPTVLKDDMLVYLYVAVTDTGPGLTPKELDMLFQRFSQVSPKTHTVFGGSGLGLFVCRKITEIMGGRIEVTSQHGKGSTFRFFVRAKTCKTAKRQHSIDATNASDQRPALKKRHTGPSKKAGFVGPKPHVLIVEDNLINQTVLARQLRHVGLTCEVASNGLEALEKIRKVASKQQTPQGQAFDCVLMDIEMPVMDGLTALKHIREEEAAGQLSLNLVIALTGNARQGQIDVAKAAGMDEVVIKPYRLDDLLHKIEDMMRIRASLASQPASSPKASAAGTIEA